jgi:hypothetical protein
MDRKRTLNSMCENRTLTEREKRPRLRRQDKGAASDRVHVVGWLGDFWHPASSTCWRFLSKHPQFQCAERHLHNQGRRVEP